MLRPKDFYLGKHPCDELNSNETSTVHSVLTRALKVWIFSNKTDSFRNNLSVTQILCLLMSDFISKNTKLNAGNHTQPKVATKEYRKGTHMHMSAIHPVPTNPFQHLTITHELLPFQCPLPQANIKSFPRSNTVSLIVTCVFPNHWTCIRLCFHLY